VRYRRHARNVSDDLIRMAQAVRTVHLRHAGQFDEHRMVSGVLAEDAARIGWLLVDLDSRS
jgi:hypothetical protein